MNEGRDRLLLAAALLTLVTATPPQAPAGAWEPLTTADGLPAAEVRSLWVDADGGLWLGTRGEGLVHYADGTWSRHGRQNGLPSDSVADILRDRRGRLWVATARPGALAVLEGDRWTAHRPPEGWDTPVIFNLTQDPDDDALWVAASGFAARWQDGRWSRPLTVDDGLPHGVVHDVHVDRFGTVWLACRQGLARHLEGETVAMFHDYNFRALLEGPDGRLWLGTGADGILTWDEMTWEHHLAGSGAHPALFDRDGDLWAKTDGAGVYRYDGAEWHRTSSADGLPGDVVHDIAEAPDGTIWIATDRGVARRRP